MLVRSYIVNMKTIYLSVDDSPSARFLDKLEFLKSHDIPAVFFCIGQLMEGNEDVLIEAIKSGFVLGNHSYSHPHFSDLSLGECVDEIKRCDDLLEGLYDRSGIERQHRWFRFPFGDKGDGLNGVLFKKVSRRGRERRDKIQEVLMDMGYTQMPVDGVSYGYYNDTCLGEGIDSHWTFDVMEWCLIDNQSMFGISSEEKVLARLEEKDAKDCRGKIKERPRGLYHHSSTEVLLLHDHVETHAIFEGVIDKLVRDGFTFR